MNKLRLIRIYEIRKQVHPIEQKVINILDGIEEERYPGYIEYKKKCMEYFIHYLNSDDVYLNRLRKEFTDEFGFYYNEMVDILKYLLEKHLSITINRIF